MTDPREVRMTTTDREVETIAARLTKAQRDRLMGDADNSINALMALQFIVAGLIDGGLDDSTCWRWSSLGSAVRAHLASQERDKA